MHSVCETRNLREQWIKVGNCRILAKRCMTEQGLGLNLSKREIETLFHIAMGKTAIEAAEAMAVAPNTISTYKARIFSKLNVSSMSEAIVIATAIVCGSEIEFRGQRALEAA